LRKISSAATVTLALVIAGLIVTPVSLWRHQPTDFTYSGFDPNLIFSSPSGPANEAGTISVAPPAITITALPGSHPTVHLVTTPLSFTSTFDVQIVSESSSSNPLRVGVWSPETGAGQFLTFDAPANDTIRAQTIVRGTPGQDLLGGTMVHDEVLGQYTLGEVYHLTLTLDRHKQSLRTRIATESARTALDVTSTATSSTAPEVFAAFRPTLTLSAASNQGISTVSVANFALTLPSQPASAAEESEKITDRNATALVTIIWVLAVALTLIAIGGWLKPRVWPALTGGHLKLMSKLKSSTWAWLGVAGVIFLLANTLLFGVGGLQFDLLAAKVWSYVALKDGLAALYYHPLVVTTAAATQGVPTHEALFPYGITSAYFYLFVGWIYHLGLSPTESSFVNSSSLELMLKAFNVIFAFADSIFIYLILRRLIKPRTAGQSALLFAINPAVVFVMSVWGATETFSLLFVLGSIWFAENRKPLGSFLMLAAAAFTRPQMLVLGFLLGLIYLRLFGVRNSLIPISWTVVAFFIALGPFALAISPSLPIDYVMRTLTYHFANGQGDPNYLGLSPGYFSLWTIPLEFVNGEHGLARMWSPSTLQVFGSVTYGQLASDLSAAFVLLVGGLILFSSGLTARPGQYLPLVAFAMLGWLMLTPGLISRYFVYAIALIILCRQFWSTVNYICIVALLSVITFVTVYGHLAHDALGNATVSSVLYPNGNSVSHFIFAVFSSDRFITVGTVANIVILALTGATALVAMRRRGASAEVLESSRPSAPSAS